MSVEDQFKAAVEIIRSLPKNGGFQPPYSMQLTFYSYYKQATSGPCNGARPAFWDVVGRAKYDAWQSLGSMEKEAAMKKYVSEFVGTIKQLQEKATPDEVQEALSYAEPKHIALFKPLFGDAVNNSNVPADIRGSSHSEDDIEKIDGHDSDDEEFSDTFNHLDVERSSPEQADIVSDRAVIYKNMKNSSSSHLTKAGGGEPSPAHGPPTPMGPYVRSSRDPFPHSVTWSTDLAGGNPIQSGSGGRHPRNPAGSVQPVDNLSYAVVRLQYTMDEVVRRLDKLERTLHEQRTRKWSLFGGVQPHILVAIFSWPLLVQLIIYYVRRRRVRVQLHLK